MDSSGVRQFRFGSDFRLLLPKVDFVAIGVFQMSEIAGLVPDDRALDSCALLAEARYCGTDWLVDLQPDHDGALRAGCGIFRRNRMQSDGESFACFHRRPAIAEPIGQLQAEDLRIELDRCVPVRTHE